MRKTAFLYDERFMEHETGDRFPENNARLTATLSHLKQQPWFGDMLHLKANSVDREWLEKIHHSEFIDATQQLCEAGARNLNDPDVRVCSKSYEVATLATGGVLKLVTSVMEGEVDNGFALVRPPGHHAEADRAMGFCLFNNVAVAAKYVQTHYGLEKVLILDWDVHHGNGTQHSFEEDPSVFFVSLHQYPLYPGTGAHSESGIGRGRNATLNCPMPAGCGDDLYREAFVEKIFPAIHKFKPDVILISAGFDAHKADPLAQINLSSEFYGWMSHQMLEFADQYSQGRLISMLEGGYDLNALPICISKHLIELMGASLMVGE